jgi:hypothetical protein
MKKLPHAWANPVTDFLAVASFLPPVRRPSWVRLSIIACCDGLDAVTPQVGSKVGQSETWISLNEFLTELCAWLATRSCAKIEILDGPADLLGEHTALIGFCSEEPASKIHVVSTEKSCSAANIDQNDLRLKQFALSHQIFLHVDQND